VQAPVGRRTELQAIGQRVLDITVAVITFGERDPRQVGGTGARHERIAELALQVRLLDIDVGGAVQRRAVLEISGEVRRPDRVELVGHAQVETLDVESGAARAGLAPVVLLVDVGQVEVHLAAKLGVVHHLRQLVQLGLGRLRGLGGLCGRDVDVGLRIGALLQRIQLRLQGRDLRPEFLQLLGGHGRGLRGSIRRANRIGHEYRGKAEPGCNGRREHVVTHGWSPFGMSSLPSCHGCAPDRCIGSVKNMTVLRQPPRALRPLAPDRG
jgi:hypothetical protein